MVARSQIGIPLTSSSSYKTQPSSSLHFHLFHHVLWFCCFFFKFLVPFPLLHKAKTLINSILRNGSSDDREAPCYEEVSIIEEEFCSWSHEMRFLHLLPWCVPLLPTLVTQAIQLMGYPLLIHLRPHHHQILHYEYQVFVRAV